MTDQREPSDLYIQARLKPVEHPLEIRYGEHLSAAGYTILNLGTPQGGEILEAVLYWHDDKSHSQCYKMRVQVQDESGHVWVQENRDHLDAFLPTKRWIRGETVSDLYMLQLPYPMPAGKYTLRMSVFDSHTEGIQNAYRKDGLLLGDEPAIALFQVDKNKSNITASELQQQNQLENPYFVDMGDLRLIGFKPVVRHINKGTRLAVGLYWRARREPTENYTVFVQIRNLHGSVIFEEKNLPANGTYPTTEWSNGEVLLDWHDLVVPDTIESDEYSIWAGLYDSKGDTIGQAQLAQLTIIP